MITSTSLRQSEWPLPGLGRRVLLVDDDVVQLKLVKLQLESAGFVVRGACGASAAEEALREELPAAIVSDVVMENVDGFTLCKRLRADQRLASTPIVLLSSAFDEAGDVALARSLGANALVSRSANQQACIEALVQSLAEGAPSPTSHPSNIPDLYGRRMAHQLVRLTERRAFAEERYESIFEHASDAIALSTVDGIILDVNHRWEEIIGLSREEIRGRHVREVSSPGQEDVNVGHYATVIGAEAGRSPPIAIGRANGMPLFLEFTTTTIDVDGAPAVLSIGRDVTALVEATRKLEARERQYRSLVENVPDVLWSTTHDWKYTFFSPNIEKLSGYSAEDIVEGRDGARLGGVHSDDIERVRAAREGLAANGTPMDLECRWQHRDGRWLWIHLRAVKTPTGIDGIFSDITVRKELEEQLLQAQKIEAIGQLTAGIAHDFNNILAVIGMSAACLVEDLPAESEVAGIAGDIVDASQRGAQLTKQLLAFSRRKPAAPQALDLNALLTGLERMLVRTVGIGVKVTMTHDEELGIVHADAGQLEQVIMNLAVNARDAMNDKGTLHIETVNVDLDETAGLDTTPPPGSYVRISVTDDGCGMDRATQEKVFEPFFTTKEDGRGTGLGLATCYGIVRHADGYITIDSEPGRGTTFHVYLPRAKARGLGEE